MRKYKFDKPVVESSLPPTNTNVLWIDVEEGTNKVLSLKEFKDGEWGSIINSIKDLDYEEVFDKKEEFILDPAKYKNQIIKVHDGSEHFLIVSTPTTVNTLPSKDSELVNNLKFGRGANSDLAFSSYPFIYTGKSVLASFNGDEHLMWLWYCGSEDTHRYILSSVPAIDMIDGIVNEDKISYFSTEIVTVDDNDFVETHDYPSEVSTQIFAIDSEYSNQVTPWLLDLPYSAIRPEPGQTVTYDVYCDYTLPEKLGYTWKIYIPEQ